MTGSYSGRCSSASETIWTCARSSWKKSDRLYRNFRDYVELDPKEIVDCVPADEAFERELDPRLRALREQMGPAAWRQRVEEAKAREQIMKDVLRLQADGHALEAGLALLGKPMATKTLRTWLARYRRHGLAGLLNRGGVVRKRPIALPTPPHRKSGRTIRHPVASFLKWAGSKQQLIPHIRERVPKSFGTYYEPMVGSGSVFFALAPRRAVFGDVNAELMNCYRVIRDQVGELIAVLTQHVNTYEHYIAVRALVPDDLPEVERAARTIYLNKTCDNGLYRVSRSGRFNVPYGWSGHAKILDVETRERVHRALQGVELRAGSYEDTLGGAGDGDVVYLDPPFAVRNRRSRSFHAYQPEAFDEAEHHRLSKMFRALCARGCHALLSNSDVPLVHELYGDFDIDVLPVTRKIHKDASKRKGWSEILITGTRARRRGARRPANQMTFGWSTPGKRR
jgi:DNA adenine methylase Dam